MTENVKKVNSEQTKKEDEGLLKITKLDKDVILIDYFKLFNKDDIINGKIEVIQLNLLFPINCKILNKEEYNKIFKSWSDKSDLSDQTENKKRISTKMENQEYLDKSLINKVKPFQVQNQKIKQALKVNDNFSDPQRKFYSAWTTSKLEDEINKYKKNIKDLEEENLKKDKLNKDIKIFTSLFEKWLRISQDAVYSILEMFPQNQNYDKNTIKTLIQHFKIDEELIMYDKENECFK